MRAVLVASLLASLATPAIAQEFFIAQDTFSKRCQIVDVRPSTPAMEVVGRVYVTRDEASRAMAALQGCRSN